MKLFNAFALAALAFGANFSAVLGDGLTEVAELKWKLSLPSSLEDKFLKEIAGDAVDAAKGAADPGRRLSALNLNLNFEQHNRRLQALPDINDVAGLPLCNDLQNSGTVPTAVPGTDLVILVDCKYQTTGSETWYRSVADRTEAAEDEDCGEIGPGEECLTYTITFYAYRITTQISTDAPQVYSPSLETTVPQDVIDFIVGYVNLFDNFVKFFTGQNPSVGKLYNPVLPASFVVQGDPHFKTWSGKWFDFMGECDMKMVHAPHFDGEDKPLDVDVRTKIRYDYSFVESAAIKMGNDTLEVASYGDYFLNGVAGAAMPAFVGGYPVAHYNPSKKIHIFEVTLGDNEKITIKTFKDLVAVTLTEVDSSRFTGSLGMAGSFDKNGKMLGRDGETEITDPNAFANEWQIREDETSLFHVAKGPQHPEQCKLPEVSTSEKRRRLGEGLAREKAERACAHFSGEHFENCVFDVMAVGDIEIAQAGVY